MGHHFREQEDSALKGVPVFVIDAVDEALDLLGALQMACAALEDDCHRIPLWRLAEMVRNSIRPFSTEALLSERLRRDGS